MEPEVIRRIKNVMSKVFDVPVDQIEDDIEIGKIPPWDSLGQLNLMLALEGEFGVHFTTEHVLSLNSLRKIAKYLEENS